MVTNGNCWCFYPMGEIDKNKIYANLLFPFESNEDANELFNLFEVHNVENDSLKAINIESDIILNNKLNNIADHIMSAIDHAILSEALLEDDEVLKNCYVSSDSRTKFDSTIQMHLSQYRPSFILPATKIRRDKSHDELSKGIKISQPNVTSPVTLLIGSVGSGKSTYLKHFELVKYKEQLKKQEAHWIYIDFEKLGKDGNPRKFIYDCLNQYLLEDNVDNPTDYESVVKPAYEKEIAALSKGPYALLYKNKEKFEEKIIEIIDKDFKEVEPYVEKIFKYISSIKLCVIVIDNVDLYEDEDLETKVFSEAISITKKIKSNTIVSIRDTTFIKHKNNSIFNAYELKKFWINPPLFREILSKRLNYAKHMLKDKEADIELNNGAILKVDDLSLFFSIIQKSVLNENNSKLIEYLSDRNPRKGITLIQNFLTSGHIQADKAISNYINGEANFIFPFHEVFKGSILGQWKYYKETRAEAFNIFDSSLGSNRNQLLRLYILKLLYNRAKIGLQDVNIKEIIDTISKIGVSEDIITNVINSLKENNLIHSNDIHTTMPNYHITLCGGYYVTNLSSLIVYSETVLYDTNIFDTNIFESLCNLTNEIENHRDQVEKMKLRQARMDLFMTYLTEVENFSLSNTGLDELKYINVIKDKISKEYEVAVDKIQKRVLFNSKNDKYNQE